MSTTDNSSVCKQSADDLKQFDKLFTELLAESVSSQDDRLIDAMKWFKQASTNVKFISIASAVCHQVKQVKGSAITW